MHGMLKRAAASAIPALLGLAVSPASAMAAPHTGRAVAGPVMGGRGVHERLARLPRPGMIQGRLAGTTGTAETTADTYRFNGAGAGFAATPAIPVILAFQPIFIAIPICPGALIDGRPARLVHFLPGSGPARGGPANGIIAYGKNDKIIGNRIFANGGTGFDESQGGTTGNGAVGTAGIPGAARLAP